MKTRVGKLGVLAFATTIMTAGAFIGPANVSAASVMDDNFNDNSLNRTRWNLETTPTGVNPSISEVNQRLELTMGPGSGGGGVVSQCSLTGSFDIRVDYRLLSWPANNKHSVRIGTPDLSGPLWLLSLNRSSFQTESYTYVTSQTGTLSTPTSHSTGTLRLVRSGSALTAYFASGGNWIQVGSATSPTGPTRVNLDVGTADSSAPAVKIAFDNFVVSGQISCPGQAPPPTPPCRDVLFIGVRGSGQSDDPRVSAGMGSTVHQAYLSLQRHLPKSYALRSFPLSYPAVSVSSFATPFYFQSVQVGEGQLASVLGTQPSACPIVVTAGYSQGAHVIGNVMTSYSQGIRVAGAVLFGDPRFNPLSTAADGNFNRVLSGFLGPRGEYPGSVQSRIRSYCRRNDPVCNYSPQEFAQCLAKQAAPILLCREHQSYVQTLTEQAGLFLAKQVTG